MAGERPEFPLDSLHAAARDNHAARDRIDALHRELNASSPKAETIKEHVAQLRKHAPVAAIIANWFDDPRTQMFINDIVQAGL
jgi:hypothetical protein